MENIGLLSWIDQVEEVEAEHFPPGTVVEDTPIVSAGVGGKPAWDEPGGMLRMLEKPDGTIWGINEWVYRYDGQEWRLFTEADGLLSKGSAAGLLVDHRGTVWIGSTYLSGRTMMKYRWPDPSEWSIGVHFVDRQNRIWGSNGKAEFMRDDTGWYRVGRGVISSVWGGLAEGPYGELWMDDGNQWGVLIGREWYRVEDGRLPIPMLVDRHGYVWLADKWAPTLVEGTFAAGPHRTWWDGRDAAERPVGSGVYFCQLSLGDRRLTRKLTLLR